MGRLWLPWFLCLYAVAVSLAERRAGNRREKSAGSRLRFAADAPEHDAVLLPGQCLVSGMALFEGSMWSPQPCSVCQCQRGAVSCRPVPCAGSNNQQTRAPRAKKLDDKDGKDNKDDKDGKDGLPERRKSAQRRGGSSSSSATRGRQEIRPKKEERIVAKTPPPAVAVKPVVAKKKPQQVLVKVASRREGPVARVPAARPTVPTRKSPRVELVARVSAGRHTVPTRTRDSFHSSDEEDFDDFDDDDDDDFVGPPLFRATVLPVSRAMPRPALTPVRRLVPAAPAVPAVPAGAGRPVVTFPSRPSFMESLPAGCLLSESLIACGSTGLTHMPVINDLGVRILYLADNRISKIPIKALAGMPNLEWLDLSKNKLDDTSLSPLLFQNLTKMRRLILDGNNLTKVPAFLPPSLMELKINDNKLSALTPSSFKGLSKLLTLELEDNYFHDGNVSPLTFRPLKKLIYLRMEDNKFRAIPSGLPASIQELHLSDNKIEVVHAGILNKTVNLRVLDLSNNRIREDRIAPQAWIHLLKLEYLDLSHNKLVHVPSFLPSALLRLQLHHNQIERIPGYVFGHMNPGLDSLHLSHNRLQDDGVDGVSFVGLSSSLAELLMDHNQMRSVPRGMLGLKNLQLLRLNNNFISHVPMNALCDTNARDDSPLVTVHLEYNLIQRRLIPPTAFSCIKHYHGVLLRPQSHEEDDE